MSTSMRAWMACLLVCWFIVSPALAGEIYKWTDENGKVHFGDRPAGENAEKVVVQPAPQSSYDAKQRQERKQKRLRVIEEERQIKREEMAKAEEERKERQYKCRVARNEVSDLRQGGLMYELDENGKRHYLSDADVGKRIDQWRKEVDRWCK